MSNHAQPCARIFLLPLVLLLSAAGCSSGAAPTLSTNSFPTVQAAPTVLGTRAGTSVAGVTDAPDGNILTAETTTPTRTAIPVPSTPTATATATVAVRAVEATSTPTLSSGNRWNGKFHSVISEEFTGDRPSGAGGGTYGAYSCSNETWDGEFQVDVGVNGDVQGTGSAHLTAPPKCSGSPPQMNCNAGLAASLLEVKGTFDGKQFHISFPLVAVSGDCGMASMYLLFWPSSSGTLTDFAVPLIAPGDAEGQVNNAFGPQTDTLGGTITDTGTHTFTLLCDGCK